MPEDALPEIDFDHFSSIEIRTGVVQSAVPFPEARKPAIKLEVDFGPEIGVRQSSAQLTRHYRPEELVGTEVLAVLNLPPRRVAGFRSEVLILGMINPQDPGDVVLVRPDQEGTRGWRLG